MKKQLCTKCRSAKFKAYIGHLKPKFVCDNGCDMGSQVIDGDPWFKNASNTTGKTYRDFVEFY